MLPLSLPSSSGATATGLQAIQKQTPPSEDKENGTEAWEGKVHF